MMKVFAYSCREFDERILFEQYGKELGIEVSYCQEAPILGKNLSLADGFDCISVITTEISAKMLEQFHDFGIGYISTRTIGYDHIDIEKARQLGIHVGNAVYGPNGVADYAIMLMLMCIRKMKRIMQRAEIQDFSLKGIQGSELSDMTVGVIGTGRIGRQVIRELSGFGCHILACDIYEQEDVRAYVEYVSLKQLLSDSDIITLHMPLTQDNFHLIDAEHISMMKDNVVIINTARGALIDSQALIAGIESGKIGAAGLDVVENEFGLYYHDLKSDVLTNRELAVLKSFPNVIVTPHMAFYTDNAIREMVQYSLESCKCYMMGKENPWEVV